MRSLASVRRLRSLLLATLCWIAAGTASAAGDILILGDSISAGYGIGRDQGWVALLQQRLQQAGQNRTVVNASISGETTDGGRNRLPGLLTRHRPGIVVVELGGNDGLRGFQIDRLRENLADIVQQAQRANAKVLLVGMKMPPNYGLRYTSDFAESFSRTSQRFDVPLVPFLLDGIVTDPGLMQDDGIHPTAAAQQKLLDNVWPHLKTLL